ncbi:MULTISPECIES: hypothetical protein [unclassified Paenibacillus]|uniref:hypothetical protein n=1 Tax=unclassified Paenibacillus TaxID=185978 RepID=UPI003119DA29
MKAWWEENEVQLEKQQQYETEVKTGPGRGLSLSGPVIFFIHFVLFQQIAGKRRLHG